MDCCSNCVFFEKPEQGAYSGQCKYPVPEYLRIAVTPFIGNPDYQGRDCATHKSRKSLIQDAANVDA